MIYNRIKTLCKKHGETITGLEQKLGFARGSLYKIDEHKPSSKRVQLIADYFNVSAEYILTGEENKNSKESIILSSFERKIIEAYRTMDNMQESVCKLLGLEEEYKLDKLYRGEAAM